MSANKGRRSPSVDRIVAGMLVAIRIAAIALGILLFFTHVAPGGAQCGTALAPKEPANDPLRWT